MYRTRTLALTDFSDRIRLLNSTYGDARHDKLLRHRAIMAEEVGGVARALEDRGAAKEVVRWIHKEHSGSTNQDYRVFGRRATDANGTEPPESIDRVSSTESSDQNNDPDPGKMVRWEEGKEIAETALSVDATPVDLLRQRPSQLHAVRTSLFSKCLTHYPLAGVFPFRSD